MKRHWVYFLLLYSMCFVSCKHDKTAELLNLAEKQLWAHPDSTLLILEQISSPQELQEKEQADYALLLTQAQYRNRIVAPSDSLINIAIDYYKRRTDADRIGTCYLYKGGVLDELKKSEQAMQAYKKAEEYIPQMKNKQIIARIYSQLGFLNYQFDNYDLAKLYHVKSLNVNKQAGDTSSVAANLINLGSVFLSLDQEDSASWCSSQLLKIISAVDSDLQTKIYHNVAIEKIQRGDYQEAEKQLKKLNELTHGKLSSKSLSAWGELYSKTGRQEKVDSLLKAALHTTDLTVKANIYSILCMKAEEAGEYKKESDYLKEYISTINSILREQRNTEIRKLQLKYDHSVSLQQNAELRTKWYATILMAIVILLVLLTLYYRSVKIYQSWKKKELSLHKLESIQLQSRIDELQIKIEEGGDIHKREKDDTEREIITLQKEKAETEVRIKQLETMFRAKNIAISTIDAESLQIFLKVKKNKEYCPAAERDKLQHWIDIAYNNFASKFRTQYPSLTEREKDICYLSLLDFTLEEIAQLLNVQPRSIERYISRICEKLGFVKGSKECFITYLRSFCHDQEAK